MEILAEGLKDYVVNLDIGHVNTGLTIEFCRLYDSLTTELNSNYVYIVSGNDIYPENIPDGSNLIVIDNPGFKLDTAAKVNIINIDGIQPYQAINIVLSIFDKYNILSEKLERAFASNAHLQTIVDISTEIIGAPIAMLDMNHCVLSMSQSVEPEGDKMWEAMKSGYGYAHYSIVDISQPKLHEMDEKGQNVWEDRSNISGRYQRVYLLRKGTKGVASFGLHKLTDVSKPFDAHIVQLADWVVDRLKSRLDMFSEVKIGRGKLSEAFLIDLLDGKTYSEADLNKMIKGLSIDVAPKYYLGMVLFRSKAEPTKYDFALMDYIETILPGSNCVEYEGRPVFLLPMTNGEAEERILQYELPNFLNIHGCYCLLSSGFPSLSYISEVFKTTSEVIPFVSNLEREDDEIRVYRYYEFALQHAISLYAKQVPLKFAEDEAIARVIRYDQENNSEYYKTLVEYIANFGNTTKTSEKLHIHRNSLLYRLSKIEKIIGKSLEDRNFRNSALFSITCNDYGKEYGAIQEDRYSSSAEFSADDLVWPSENSITDSTSDVEDK